MKQDGASDLDQYLFHEGRHFRAYEFMGAHLRQEGQTLGVRFTVWAPHAQAVGVGGDFNHWDAAGCALHRISSSGLWQGFAPGLKAGDLYKYEITGGDGVKRWKADPYAFQAETPPGSASKVSELRSYSWGDDRWRQETADKRSIRRPMAIYEVHLGSWRRHPNGSFLSYRELAAQLPAYVADMGFTHVEILPVAEHPYTGSWGYQVTGYYAPTSRLGCADDFRALVDAFHQHGIGVIMDWVPGHFCKDNPGLRQFDGAPLYESDQPQLAENYGWGTLNFDFSRPEVWSFLISNAIYWMDVFHLDGLRADAVANMLYRDYGRGPGEWLPNCYGGHENLEAAAFLRKLNEAVHQEFPAALVIAEESTTWPSVTKPVYLGGLGFDYKWNMGWMNDTLRYMSRDPIYRSYDHNLLTFSFLYAFSENFLLPLSHDEVVHGKKSLLDKMPGDYWQKFANLRAFYGYFMAHPGKKLLFMGGEFGQFAEWSEDRGLDWKLLDYEKHRELQHYVKDLNAFYREEEAFWRQDTDWQGFEWIDCCDVMQSIISFLRKTAAGEFVVVVCNFTPVVRHGYRIGVPKPGRYREVFNSDWRQYGGSGQENGVVAAKPEACHGRPFSLSLTIPPLAAVFLKCNEEQEEGDNA